MSLFKQAGSNTLTLALQGTGDVTVAWGDGTTQVLALTGSYQNFTKVYADTTQRSFDFTVGANNITGWDTGSGNIGGEFPTLTNLTFFYLTGNNTVSSLAGLTNLTSLYLTGNNTVSSLAGLTNLTFFYLEGQNTVSSLAGLTNLTYLGLAGQNTVSHIPSGLAFEDQVTVKANSTSAIDGLIKSAYAYKDSSSYADFYFYGDFAPTDTMAAVSDGLAEGGSISRGSEFYYLDETPRPAVETNDSLPYNTLVNQPPLAGFFLTGDAATDNAIKSASTQLAAGPEPTNLTPPVLSISGSVLSWTPGTWNTYSNGTLTLLATIYDASDNVIASGLSTHTTTGGSFDLAGEAAGGYTVVISASNNGGNDPDSDERIGPVTYSPITRAHNPLRSPFLRSPFVNAGLTHA